jgi:hypothetical protein
MQSEQMFTSGPKMIFSTWPDGVLQNEQQFSMVRSCQPRKRDGFQDGTGSGSGENGILQ